MFSHIGDDNNPRMVDISPKEKSHRRAHARTIVVLPSEVLEHFHDGDIRSKKGSVFHTAIIAGVMAAKKTWQLIPFCHDISLDSCNIDIKLVGDCELTIDCVTKSYHKTGVEMEALVGSSMAALTVYDMCKSFSKKIVIKKTELIEKTGGKSDFIQGI